MADEIDWDDTDELAADRAMYTLTGDVSWLLVIAELERKLGVPPWTPPIVVAGTVRADEGADEEEGEGE